MRFARSSFTTLPVVQIYYLGLLALLLSVGRTLAGDIVRYLFCSVQYCATSSCDLHSRSHRNPVDSYEISTIRGTYAKFTIPVPVLPCFVPSLAHVVADGGESSPGLSGFSRRRRSSTRSSSSCCSSCSCSASTACSSRRRRSRRWASGRRSASRPASVTTS